VGDARLLKHVTERLESDLRIQGRDVLLGVQEQRLARETLEDSREELLRESLAAAIRSHDDATHDAVSVSVFGPVVEQHTEVGGRAPLIRYPKVNCRWLAVSVVELRFVDFLLDEEDVRAQLE
jgi:hypothetical protein